MVNEVRLMGADRLKARLVRLEDELQQRRGRAARAAANVVKVVMRQEAPYSPAAQRDTARKRRHVKHLRATIRVRRVYSASLFSGGQVESYAVGPASPLAHLVVRGTKARHEEVGQSSGTAGHRVSLASARQLRFAARGFQGPKFGEAHALAWNSGGGTVFAASSNPGPMHGNDFIVRTREIVAGEARAVAGAVLFHNIPDPNEV